MTATKTPNLSDIQKAALRLMQERTSFGGCAQISKATAESLEKLGFVKLRRAGTSGRGSGTITDEGRKYLESLPRLHPTLW